MNNITDSKQRKSALNPEQSFIVRAPAGSGKTELLIRRFLRLLSGVETPEEIIAITFTRKAAAEMRGRIIAALDLARGGETPEDEYKEETFLLAREVLERDETQQWHLQDNPGRLRIQTIDSLCSSITRQMPMLSQLGAQPETLDDASDLYLQAAERTIMELESGDNQSEASWSEAVFELLQHLDNDLPRLKQLLADMLSRRDQWLRHVTNGNISREELDQALHNIVSAALRRAQKAFTDSEELIGCLNYAANNLIEEGTESLITQCAELDALPVADPDALSQWHGLAEILLTKQNEWRKTVNKNTGFPAGEKIIKDRFIQLLASYADNEDLLEALTDIRCLPEVWTSSDGENAAQKNETQNNKTWINDSQWNILQVLPTLLVMAEAQLRVLFSEHSKIDFTGIEQSALQALGGDEQPSDLALQLDYRIQHILVDEFQDVSVSQYELLERLTEGWSVNDGRSLFLVGDPMQSIYRFREAEVGKFLSTFTNHRLGQVPLESLTLEVNFRSRQGVVNWVNDSFIKILPQEEDIANSAVSYSPVVAADDSGEGQVVIHPLFQNDTNGNSYETHQQEAKQISHLIKEIQEANQKSEKNTSIAILVRGRPQLDAIIPHLKQAEIRFQAVDIERLDHRPAIQDCLALTRALLHPADRVAWLSILRAPWCGLSLADLDVLAGKPQGVPVWAFMNDELRMRKLSEDGHERLLKLREILTRALANRRRKSLRRMVEQVWMECGGPATLEDASDLENVQTFFDVLQQEEESSDLKSLAKLEKAVEGLYAAADVQAMDDDAHESGNIKLQIMTIHKAKGLEFDIVILPGLGRGGKAEDKRLLLWQEQQREDGGNDLLLAPIKETGIEDDKLYRYLEILEKTKLKNEEGRLLYVAATRAREQLHLFGTTRLNNDKKEIKPPKKNSLLAKLWPAVEANYQWVFTSGHSEVASKPTLVVEAENRIRRHQSSWSRPSPPDNVIWQESDVAIAETTESDIEFEWASETIRHVGVVVHRCIQLMAEDQTKENKSIWDKKRIQSQRAWFRQALKRQGVGEEDIHWASQQVEEALVNMIKDERGQWLLSAEHQQQHNEYALTGVHTGKVISIKIDRTFVDQDGTRWIIDYKTSRHEEEDVDAFLDQQQERYKEQLEKYGALMELHDDRPMKLGLYFPLLQGWREWKC
ncbi:MAG: UvrD-helicase domain-containing protein [Proteobacteria bacterium]|nr:UvrD-helicase domain-containing protein [Pseudomonadota bacterium]